MTCILVPATRSSGSGSLYFGSTYQQKEQVGGVAGECLRSQ